MEIAMQSTVWTTENKVVVRQSTTVDLKEEFDNIPR